jgi:signal peptidase II
MVAKWWPWIVLIVVIDQATKWLVEHTFAYGERMAILPFFDVIRIYNTGAAFGFLASGSGWQRWVLIAVALGAIGLIVWLMRTQRHESRLVMALALILSGAIGNLIDRIWHGHVIDFVLIYWHPWYYPAFNVADMAITLGAILLIWDEWQRWRRNRST